MPSLPPGYSIVSVLVTADSPGISTFSLVAYKQATIVELERGVPLQAAVGVGSPSHIRYALLAPHVGVEVVLTPLSGDPDVFVSWRGEGVPYTTETAHDAAATGVHNNTLRIKVSGLCFETDGVCPYYLFPGRLCACRCCRRQS